jgi:hypothetical protein
MKGGTTWLFENLRRHPAIWLPPVKELGWFNLRHGSEQGEPGNPARIRDRARLGQEKLLAAPPGPDQARLLACYDDLQREPADEDWYRRLFAHRRAGEVSGDVSPTYALLPPAGIAAALEMNPRLKVLALLRDPAERAFSHMVMHAGEPPAEAQLRRMMDGPRWPLYAFHSDYAMWLGRWAAAVGRDRLHIETQDRIGAAPQEVLARICAVLGIAPDAKAFRHAGRKVLASRKDSGGLRHLLPEIRARLAPAYAALRRDWPDVAAALGAKD